MSKPYKDKTLEEKIKQAEYVKKSYKRKKLIAKGLPIPEELQIKPKVKQYISTNDINKKVPLELQEPFIQTNALKKLLDDTGSDSITVKRLSLTKHTVLEENNKEYDFIKPQHYKLWNDNTDTLEVLYSVLGYDGYLIWLKGTILKYQLRLGKKPGESIERDQDKIKFYQDEYDRVSTQSLKQVA